MRREVKTYEWACDRCGLVEETRYVPTDDFSPFPGMFAPPAPLPDGWAEERHDWEKVQMGWSQLRRHVCASCAGAKGATR